jgi:hypothetical protein
MFMDITENRAAPLTNSLVQAKNLLSRLAAAFVPPRRSRPIANLSDNQLADLNLRRSDVAQIDPRQVSLF